MGGEWESLVDEARERQAQPARQAGVGTTPPADPGFNPTFTRARRLARVGELSRAVQALDDTKVVQGTPDTIAALQAKHPAAPPAARLDNDEDAWERAKETLPFLADIQPADVIKVLKSATRGAAQDCMGWRVESLQALCAFPDAIEALTSLIRALARGDLHDSATELLTRARLVALAKEDGGIRPIGICAVFRNLVGRILLSAWREDLDAHFTEKGGNGRLLQLAVGVPRGTQICCTHIAEYLRLNPTHVAIEGDVRNAFNEVWRTAIVEGIMALGEEKGRSLLPFFLTVYGKPSKIAVRGADGARHFVDSQVGSTQGDVLGMLLFCLAIHPILRDTARENPDAHQAWYADNGYHLGPPAVAAAAAAQNQRLLGERAGLHIKGWTVIQGRSSPVLSSSTFTDAGMVGDISFVHLGDTRAGHTVGSMVNGVKCLGSPLGSPAFQNAFVNERNNMHQKRLHALISLSAVDAQVAKLLLIHCALPRLIFLTQTTPLDAAAEAFEQGHASILDAWMKIVDLSDADMDVKFVRDRVTMPLVSEAKASPTSARSPTTRSPRTGSTRRPTSRAASRRSTASPRPPRTAPSR